MPIDAWHFDKRYASQVSEEKSDIVERLRYLAPAQAICGEAADEIERLREELNALKHNTP